MAYTLAYLEKNGVRVTAGSTYDVTVNVYKMNSAYTYDLIITDELVNTDSYYDIEYDEDNVYKITVLENGVTLSYADVNYCNYLDYMTAFLKEQIYIENNKLSDNLNITALSLLGFMFLCQITYTIANNISFTASQNAELQRIYNAVKRVTDYTTKIDSTL